MRCRWVMKTPFGVPWSPSLVFGAPVRLYSTSVQTAFGCSHTPVAFGPFAKKRQWSASEYKVRNRSQTHLRLVMFSQSSFSIPQVISFSPERLVSVQTCGVSRDSRGGVITAFCASDVYWQVWLLQVIVTVENFRSSLCEQKRLVFSLAFGWR